MKLLFYLAFCMWHVEGGFKSSEPNLFRVNSREAGEKMSEHQIRVAIQTYQARANFKTGFFALSTIDAFLGLSQLYFGAQGECQKQLSNVLNYSPDDIEAENGLAYLGGKLGALRFCGARMSTKIFHAFESDLEDSFTEKMYRIFHSVPKRVPSWSEIASGGKIDEFVKNVGLPFPYYQKIKGKESLVVASASIFSSNLTLDNYHTSYTRGYFYYNDENVVPHHEYVKITTKLNYGELNFSGVSNNRDATAQYIELAWAIPWIKTYIVLPGVKYDISYIEQNMKVATINEMISNTNIYAVNVTLPRRLSIFSANYLHRSFPHMNLTEIFKETADYAKITQDLPVKVAAFMQQVEIDHHISYNSEPYDDPSIEVSRIFEANRAFMIVTVLTGETPLILCMARYGWLPGVMEGPTDFSK